MDPDTDMPEKDHDKSRSPVGKSLPPVCIMLSCCRGENETHTGTAAQG